MPATEDKIDTLAPAPAFRLLSGLSEIPGAAVQLGRNRAPMSLLDASMPLQMKRVNEVPGHRGDDCLALGSLRVGNPDYRKSPGALLASSDRSRAIMH